MMYWNVHDSINNTSSNTGISNLDGLLDVTINNPQADQVLSFNGSQFINTAVPGLSAVQSNFNNLNADNLTAGTISYARLPNLSEITLSGDAVPPYISSISSSITPTGDQTIEILGGYFSPITQLSIPGVTVNNLEVRSPNKIIANISKSGLSGNKIINLANGANTNQIWADGIKSVNIIADPYWANVSLFIKGDGENNSTNIIDSSVNPKAITRIGNTKISTDQSKYGGGSIYFDGIGSALQIENSDDWNISLYSNYTLEYWIYIISPSGTRGIISTLLFDGNFSGWSIRQADTNLTFLNLANIIKSIAISTGNWHHIALVKFNDLTSIFLNGISQGYIANSPPFSTRKLMVGCTYFPPQEFFNGYIDSIRITKGVARYNNNFNPETDTYLE